MMSDADMSAVSVVKAELTTPYPSANIRRGYLEQDAHRGDDESEENNTSSAAPFASFQPVVA